MVGKREATAATASQAPFQDAVRAIRQRPQQQDPGQRHACLLKNRLRIRGVTLPNGRARGSRRGTKELCPPIGASATERKKSRGGLSPLDHINNATGPDVPPV